MRKSIAVVTRSNYSEPARTQDHHDGQQITEYRQKSQPGTGGSNQNCIAYALAAESKPCAVGAHIVKSLYSLHAAFFVLMEVNINPDVTLMSRAYETLAKACPELVPEEQAFARL